MFSSRFFNSRHLSAYYFDGGPPILQGEKKYFFPNYFKGRFFSGAQHFSSLPSGPPQIPVFASSIAISVATGIPFFPNVARLGSLVDAIVFVYDQFNKPMPNTLVTFESSNSNVVVPPIAAYTDGQGILRRKVYIAGAGMATLTARVAVNEGQSIMTTWILHVLALPVLNPAANLTHGATIQQGSSGGGTGSMVRGMGRFSHKGRKWPTR